MKVIIAGTRLTPEAEKKVYQAIKRSEFKISEILCGMSGDVDMAGYYWAKKNNIPVKEFFAKWNTHGLAAGPIRNTEMASEAEALILIWDGNSKGSLNMLTIAKKKKLHYYLWNYVNGDEDWKN